MRHLAEGGAICLLFALALMADGLVERVGLCGIAGIGHILLGVSLVLLLVQIKRSVTAAQS